MGHLCINACQFGASLGLFAHPSSHSSLGDIWVSTFKSSTALFPSGNSGVWSDILISGTNPYTSQHCSHNHRWTVPRWMHKAECCFVVLFFRQQSESLSQGHTEYSTVFQMSKLAVRWAECFLLKITSANIQFPHSCCCCFNISAWVLLPRHGSHREES